MKTIYYFHIRKLGLLAVLVLLFIGCDTILTEEPKTFLSEEGVFSSRAGADAATKGIYASLRSEDYYGLWFTGIVEMHADYVNGRGSQEPFGAYQLNAQSIERIGIIYGGIYESINRANNVIEGVPDIDMDPNLKSQYEGEARFLRALGYFNLVRLFGGVPLRDRPTKGFAEVDLPRASEDEVYSLIIEDLQFAENNLPNDYDQSNHGRATQWAAKTVLADVYLTLERWSEAATKAKEVMDSGEFNLVRVNSSEDFHNNMFGPDVTSYPEEIFSIQFTQSIPNSSMLAFIHHTSVGYSSSGFFAWWGELKAFIGQGEWADENSPDLRRNNSLYHGQDTLALSSDISMMFSKFRGSPGNEGVDIPIVRYAEPLLIFAEALSQANGGPTSEAYEAVNMIRRRAYGQDPTVSDPGGADLQSGLSQEAFRDSVLLERGKEFILERKRWFDLVRTGTALEVIQGLEKPITEKYLKWPIAQEEIANNGALTQEDQNPGW